MCLMQWLEKGYFSGSKSVSLSPPVCPNEWETFIHFMGLKLVGSTESQVSFRNKLERLCCNMQYASATGIAVWNWKVPQEVLNYIETPCHIPVLSHTQAVLFFRHLYGTEQYLTPFVQYSPLWVKGEEDGAEPPFCPDSSFFHVCYM